MRVIWSEGEDGRELLKPAGFPDERTTHELVAEAPDDPARWRAAGVVLRQQVQLDSAYVDI